MPVLRRTGDPDVGPSTPWVGFASVL